MIMRPCLPELAGSLLTLAALSFLATSTSSFRDARTDSTRWASVTLRSLPPVVALWFGMRGSPSVYPIEQLPVPPMSPLRS